MPITYPVSYSSTTLMLTTLPELGSVTTLTSAHLTHYAGEAQAFIDARLVRNYALPLTSEVPEVQRLATDIGVYFTLRRLWTQERMNASVWPDRYKEATGQLDAIASGDVLLVTSSGSLLGARTDIGELSTTTMDYLPTFHEGPWTAQVQDPDKIDDTLDDRDLGGLKDRLL